MATTNGDVDHLREDPSFSSTNNLGKRKRIDSEDLTELEGQQGARRNDGPLQESMRATLKLLKQYDPSPSLLKYPLSSITSDEPDIKRPRLSIAEPENDCIETRVKDGFYSSYDAFINDVNRVSTFVLSHTSESTNGGTGSELRIDAKARVQITAIRDTLIKAREYQVVAVKEETSADMRENRPHPQDHDTERSGQVLTLRSQTEKGPRQLFSGLQRSVQSDSIHQDAGIVPSKSYAPLDLTKLPNGFDLADPVLGDSHTTRKDQRPPRTIGEVFRPRSSLKPLELPRSAKSNARGNLLEFVSPAEAQFTSSATPVHKNDYKYASLPTGHWLHYHNVDSNSTLSPDLRRKQRDSSFGFVDGHALGDVAEETPTKLKARFQAAYSSFAPTHDNSIAVISESTRNDLWWRKVGESRFRKLFSLEDAQGHINGRLEPMSEESNFEEAVVSFESEDVPMDAIDSATNKPDLVTPDDVLQEVSELLETLSSYQRIRNVEPVRNSSYTTSLSSAEQDTYNILKSQLQILVSSLPPFAVAKLNGDQLAELNISTTILQESPDYQGTGEPDDYTLQRRNANRAATVAASRSTASVLNANRPVYPPASTSYNQRPPAYGVQNSYGRSTPASAYQTPRPPSSTNQRPSYPQATYGANTTPYTQSTSVQQYQRPLQNGYTYGANVAAQTSYSQPPSQPGYAQRAQDSMAYARSASPQKPITNGQISQSYGQQPRPQHSAYAPAVPYSTEAQRSSMERAKMVHQQQVAQRAGSGTPQTPGGYGTYDGGAESNATPGAEVKLERSASIVDSAR